MSAPLPPDPYQALGVELSADAGVIKTAYRKLVLKCHPDKFPDPLLKAQKQDEFQRVQQAYEILGDEDKKRDYDLEVKAKKLKEELAKRGGSTNTQAHSRFVNVNIRTAEPPPGWSPSKHSTSKSSPYKPAYSREFSQSWEHEIPSRSKVYQEDDRRAARRTASYEKVKREDSRERRRRNDEDREREKRRDQDDEIRKEIKRQQKLKEKEIRDRELQREREHRDKKDRKAREAREADAKARDDARLKAEAKAEKKMRERERERDRERDRDMRRKQDADEKARAKSKPYVEHSGYSEDDDDVRRSRAKKSSSPKKQSDSPSRDKSSNKQRDRANPQDDAPTEQKYHSTLAYAASYVQQMKNKATKTSPRHTAEVPAYSAAYPDPNEKWAPSKRRASGDGKHANDPVIVDIPDPSAEAPSASPTTQQAPPRLQKSHTMPSGYMPQTQTAPAIPTRVPLGRSHTMQPEHISRPAAEKHRPTRRAFDDEDYMDDRYAPASTRVHKYQLGRDRGIPRVIDSKYDSYASPGLSFSKIKTAPSYGAEHVMTSKHYEEDDVATSHYDHMQPSYADYGRQTAVR